MIWALHGAFGGPDDWGDLGRALADVGVIAVDLWCDEHDLPLRAWASEFNRRVRDIDANPVLLGYSMGARMGLHALVEPAAQWKAAVLVSPHPGLSSAVERAARRERDDEWLRRFDSLDWREFWREWTDQPVLTSSVRRPAPPDRRASRRGLARWSLAEQKDLRRDLWQVECPVLWITGELDEKFTAIGETAAPLLPRCELTVVAGAGHRVPWDAPEEFDKLVASFLRRVAEDR
ncbi:MAG: alpha/beta fold hydrolase [Gemmatimonadota bacterium]